MTEASLARNLAFLCSYYPSIAHVCRRLAMNRQQFNKYIAGQTRPSRNNTRRICDFFGVSESELMLEPSRFRQLVELRHRSLGDDTLDRPMHHLQALYQRSGDLDRYVGYYYRYFYSFGNAGRIIRSLLRLYASDGRYYWKNLELTPRQGRPGRAVAKYEACLFYLGDRIFAVEYETLMRNAITQVTLYPSYHASIAYLSGVQTGAPATRGRRPAASRVLFEYLGPRIDRRRALRACGLFEAADPAIDGPIRDLISNRIGADAYVLEAEDI